MGTLTNILGEDEEAIKKSFKSPTKDTLDSGGADLFGVPFPLPLPTPELAAMQSQAIDDVDDLGIISSAYAQTIMALDTALPSGVISPPIFDPTLVLPIDVFFQLLIDLGITNPIEWFEAHLGELLELDITLLADCNNKEFAEALNEIDPSIDVNKAEEVASTICGFSMPSFELPVFNFEMPDFSLGLLPIELFAIPNFNFPQINWAIEFTLLGLKEIIVELIEMALELVTKIIEGIVAFIQFIVEFIFKKIIEIILAVLQPLLQGILFVAEIITYIVKVVAAVIVALVGHIIGAGVVTVIVAEKLGLAQ